jgi:hypothetical protein
VAEDDDPSVLYPQQAGQQAQQRGLAGGVGADQPGDDSWLDRRGDVAQGGAAKPWLRPSIRARGSGISRAAGW